MSALDLNTTSAVESAQWAADDAAKAVDAWSEMREDWLIGSEVVILLTLLDRSGAAWSFAVPGVRPSGNLG